VQPAGWQEEEDAAPAVRLDVLQLP